MSDLRPAGNPGGTRGKNNPLPEKKPMASENSDNKAPGGETRFGHIPKQAGANRRTAR